MRLEDLTLDLRPRPHWQAAELGFALLRPHAATIYQAWWAIWGPLVLASLVLATLFPSLAALCPFIPWFFRPLVERVVILILSRAVFGEHITASEAVRQWPSQLKGGWFRVLTWWRLLVPGRAVYQAIWQLEGASGRTVRERIRLIGKDGVSNVAFWLGMLFVHFEMILELGILALIGTFISNTPVVNPAALVSQFFENSGFETFMNTYSLLAYGLVAGLTGPLYTACGFTLYLNRRAGLEGWDIEIAFRKMANRLSRLRHTAVSVLLAGLLACGLFSLPDQATAKPLCEAPEWVTKHDTDRGPAQDAQQQRWRQKVASVYEGDELREYECESTWVSKKESAQIKLVEPLQFQGLAYGLQWVLIALLIGCVLWLLYRYRGQIATALDTLRPLPPPPSQVAGLDVRPESLPTDIVGASQALWDQGLQREALALLYRASLSRFGHHYRLPLFSGSTEGDCLNRAAEATRRATLSSIQIAWFERMTHIWQAQAYAHVPPTAEQFQALCRDWPKFAQEGPAA